MMACCPAIDRRIADLLALRETLETIRQERQALPQHNKAEAQCVCYLLTTDHQSGQVTIQREEKLNGNNKPKFNE